MNLFFKKFVYVLNYFKVNKAAHKNNPWTHSQQQNKKPMLITAAYFKVSTPVRLQRQKMNYYNHYFKTNWDNIKNNCRGKKF